MFAERLNFDPEVSHNALLSASFEARPEPLLLCDTDLRILSANQAAATLLRRAASDLLGQKAKEILPPKSPDSDRLHSTAPAGLEWRSATARHGEQHEIEVTGKDLYDPNTAVHGWLLLLRKSRSDQQAPQFIGKAPIVQELLEFVSRIARSRASSILLTGESGTGKELIARRLHTLSPRSDSPFIAVNCAALPETLFESELFGHEKGAFTSAAQRRDGLLSRANGGTVFLDEIGELPLPLQSKLLRVMEERSFRRLGGARDISVDLRIISATNKDLHGATAAGQFRSDLYYRLNGIQISLPALREHVEDINRIADHFLAQFNQAHHRSLRGIHPAARRKLELYSWPGNVRELRNAVERALLVETSSWIMPSSLSLPGHADLKPRIAADARFCLRGSERELIEAALAETNGNQTRAARLLGIGRFSLRYRMRALKLS